QEVGHGAGRGLSGQGVQVAALDRPLGEGVHNFLDRLRDLVRAPRRASWAGLGSLREEPLRIPLLLALDLVFGRAWLLVGPGAHCVWELVDGFLGLGRDSCAERLAVELPSGGPASGCPTRGWRQCRRSITWAIHRHRPWWRRRSSNGVPSRS